MNLAAFRTALLCLALGLAPSLPAHESGLQMAQVANLLISTLEPAQKAKALFGFTDKERENWHFIPRERKGLAFAEMTPQQVLLAHALLNTGLGSRGSAKAVTIMSLEEVLYQIEGADPAKREAVRQKRDPQKYFVSIFGKPSADATWGWRIEGHHLSLNFTIKDGKILRATPAFMGTNPGEVRQGNLSGLRVLGREEDLGRELFTSLDPGQRSAATIATTPPKEMFTAADGRVNPLKPDGLSRESLNAAQRGKLLEIIHEYTNRLRPELAAELNTLIESKPIHFGWAGGEKRGEPHYYRVQGPDFLIEYDNVQNEANHPHSVLRLFEGDFGRDILGEHHRQEHQR
jgi:hypothetical protein